MVSSALIRVMETWPKFSLQKINPFAYFTMVIHNDFLVYLKGTRKYTDLKDDILMDSGMMPSDHRQMEWEDPKKRKAIAKRLKANKEASGGVGKPPKAFKKMEHVDGCWYIAMQPAPKTFPFYTGVFNSEGEAQSAMDTFLSTGERTPSTAPKPVYSGPVPKKGRALRPVVDRIDDATFTRLVEGASTLKSCPNLKDRKSTTTGNPVPYGKYIREAKDGKFELKMNIRPDGKKFEGIIVRFNDLKTAKAERARVVEAMQAAWMDHYSSSKAPPTR